MTDVIISARLIAKDIAATDINEERKYLYLTLRVIELRKFRSKKQVDRSFERVEAENTLLNIVIKEIESAQGQYYDRINGLTNELVLSWFRELIAEYQKI